MAWFLRTRTRWGIWAVLATASTTWLMGKRRLTRATRMSSGAPWSRQMSTWTRLGASLSVDSSRLSLKGCSTPPLMVETILWLAKDREILTIRIFTPLAGLHLWVKMGWVATMGSLRPSNGHKITSVGFPIIWMEEARAYWIPWVSPAINLSWSRAAAALAHLYQRSKCWRVSREWPLQRREARRKMRMVVSVLEMIKFQSSYHLLQFLESVPNMNLWIRIRRILRNLVSSQTIKRILNQPHLQLRYE